MTVNPASSLTGSPAGTIFNFVQGSATPPTAQTVNVTSSSPSVFTVTGTSNWLLFSTNGQTAPGAPGTVTINADPTKLAGPGVYVAGVTVNPSSGLPPLTLPVVFYYQTSPTVAVAPTSLAFNYQPFGQNNILQKAITVTSGGTPVTFGASAGVTAQGAPWLAVTPTQGTTPGTLTVSLVAPGALSPGQYQGTVTITAAGATNTNVTVPVTLTVSSQPLLDFNISSLNYTYQVGGALPPDQFITPSSTTPTLSYTLTTATNNTGNWLSATNSGGTSAPVDVAVNPVGLPVGTYMGTVTFNAVNGGNNPQVVNVTLNVVNNPTLLTSPTSAPGLTFNYETGGSTPNPVTVQVTSSGTPLAFGVAVAQNSTSNNVNWLNVGTPTATTTPASFTVGAGTTGMAPGQYTASITLTTPGGTMQVTLPVTLNITPAGTPLLFVSPQTLTFNILTGGTAANQQVSVNTTGESIAYTATPGPTVPAGGTWLTVGPPNIAASATNISNFEVGLNASMLAPGVYKGSVILQTNNGTPNVMIPVTLLVTTGNLAASAPSLSFTQASFGPAPAGQSLTITSTGAALPLNVTTTGANWLGVSPLTGTTPLILAVTVNAANLSPGTYTGQINVASAGAGNSPLAIPVNLTVTSPQSLSLTVPGGGNSLFFSAPAGGTAPPAQTVALAASGGSLAFVGNINIASPPGGNWLSVAPASGSATTAPTNLAISVNPQGLNPGTYNGSVSINAPNANNSPLTIPVTFVVGPPTPAPAPSAIVNAGSMQAGAVAAGEIITITGTNLGPPAPGVTPGAGADNHQPTLVSDTQVTFDNVPAPLLFVSATRIDAVVPYEVDGKTQTTMVVTYKGTAAVAQVLNVGSTAPGLFLSTAANVPATQVAATNADGTDNTPDNPAAAGTVVVLRATGEGQTMPPGETGLIIPAGDDTALKFPVLPVTVTIGGQTADVQYAGSAAGSVSGNLQIKVVVPDNAPSGPAVPIVITIGPNSSPEGTTLAIQ